jgi:hypothetical protein
MLFDFFPDLFWWPIQAIDDLIEQIYFASFDHLLVLSQQISQHTELLCRFLIQMSMLEAEGFNSIFFHQLTFVKLNILHLHPPKAMSCALNWGFWKKRKFNDCYRS